MPPRRGVIVGAGGIARRSHLPAYRSGDGVAHRLRIVAAIDPAARTGDLDGIPIVASPRDLASFDPIDFVDICTPTASHYELTLSALEAGRHVLCEKPVAVTRAEAARLTATARASGRVLMPCHQYRNNPAWQQLRTWLEAGAIGRWHLAEFHVFRTEADRGAHTMGVPWRGRQAESRGGVMLDHGTHLFYQLVDVAGMPRSVQAHTARLGHAGYDVEDTAHVVLDFGDRLGVLFLTWAARERDTRIRFIGEDGAIEWIGGRLERRGRHGTESIDFSAELDKAAYYRWFAALFHRFADAMDTGDAEAGLEDIMRVATLLETAYASAGEGCRVPVA